ncbi:MAG: caspase family protein [Deltaproteobacteria bacterium]|jgi:hypothetical protein|nr:caspase family protein [Deltaproteobacteria bacterium]
MTRKNINIVLWTILIWLAYSLSMVAQAENHALLIGIGKYKQRTLEGPPYDVAALARLLTTRFNFNKRFIHTLVNEEAVRFRILDEIKLLTARTRPGDRVFIYFSGHGTSRRDDILALPLPHTSGALVPADFIGDPNRSVEKQLSQLIIGKRDLRPTLERLDRDRSVLMVFDTCFSENTVRAIGDENSNNLTRYLQLRSKSVFNAERDIGNFEDNLIRPDPYPYQNIFYISASSENEVAHDIRKNNLHLYPTFDGNPHGVLTDALLRVLAGQRLVDTDNDGQWSQIELYTAVKTEVKRRFKQSPQALPKEGQSAKRLYSRAFFVPSAGKIGRAPHRPAGPLPGLRVQVAADLAIIKKQVSAIEGATIVDTDPDLIIEKDRGDVVLTLPNRHQLCRYTLFEPHQVADRIRRQLQIQPLINLTYPRQQFNVGIELIGPYQKSIIRENESFGFEIRVEKSAYLLLIDVDPAGAVHVLYPFNQSEAQLLSAGEKTILADRYRAHWPFGTETLKLFAFSRRPADLTDFIGQEDISPESPLFKKLEHLVGIRGQASVRASVRTDAAQAELKITSYPKADMERQ